MNERTKGDLRTKKTQASIRKVFRDMLLEMNYDEITIKALTEKAEISRRTFYMHYSTLDELLNELIDEIADGYTKKTKSLHGPYDIEKITRTFLLYFAQQDELHERIICNGNFEYISKRINRKIAAVNHEHANHLGAVNQYEQSILIAYLNEAALGMYRRWVADKKLLSLDDFVCLATQLICFGATGFKKAESPA